MRVKATTEMSKRICALLETFLEARAENDLQVERMRRAERLLKDAALSLVGAFAPPKLQVGEVYCAWFSAEVGPNDLHDVVLRVSRVGTDVFEVATGEGELARRVHVTIPGVPG